MEAFDWAKSEPILMKFTLFARNFYVDFDEDGGDKFLAVTKTLQNKSRKTSPNFEKAHRHNPWKNAEKYFLP